MLAHMCGELQSEQFADTLTHEQWCEVEALDQVYPFKHTERMLGLIAYMLADRFKLSFGSSTATEVCMPWIDPESQYHVPSYDRGT